MTPTVIKNNDHVIVRFTNIAYFDFIPDMGAMYGGVPYSVPAGKSMLMPKSIGDHLATHLARQIIIQKAPIRDEKEIDGKGSDRKLWDDNSIQALRVQIVTEQYEEEIKAPQTEAERYAAKIRELNREFPDMMITEKRELIGTVAPVTENSAPGAKGYTDKADVIAELKKRGIAFDARGNKAKLESLLK